MTIRIGRRTFTAALAGAAAWAYAARAQQGALPLVGLINMGSPDAATERRAAFRKGLAETGFVEGQNVVVEYDWLDGQFDRLQPLAADLVRRRAAVIATPGNTLGAIAAKAATSTIQRHRRPGQARPGGKPRPAGRQRDRRQFLQRRDQRQAVVAPARRGAEGRADRRADQSAQLRHR
jgi:hypothetical protein